MTRSLERVPCGRAAPGRALARPVPLVRVVGTLRGTAGVCGPAPAPGRPVPTTVSGCLVVRDWLEAHT